MYLSTWGYPILLDGGTHILSNGGGGGYPFPSQRGKGVPPSFLMGTPIQSRREGVPPSQVRKVGYPILLMGVPHLDLAWGYSTCQQDGGTPFQVGMGGGRRGTPNWNSIVCIATRQAVCLSRSRRRSFLFCICFLYKF